VEKAVVASKKKVQIRVKDGIPVLRSGGKRITVAAVNKVIRRIRDERFRAALGLGKSR